MAGRHRKPRKRRAPSKKNVKKLLIRAGCHLLLEVTSNFWL
ncbi:hypothetical protein ACFYXH_40610 [Streptomyces sp. NPDC002730]